MLSRREIDEYYAKEDLWLPTIPSNRQWRIQTYDGEWKRSFIGNTQRMRRCFSWMIPKTVFYSTISYLNPRLYRAKIFDHLPKGQRIIQADVAYDFDSQAITLEDLEDTKKRVEQFLDFMGTELRIKYLCFSAAKGFHILCQDPSNVSLLRRTTVQEVQENRNNYIDALLHRWKQWYQEDCPFDEEIARDVHRFIRCPGTINNATGYVCTILPLEYIRLPIRQLLEYIPYAGKGRPRIPHRREMTTSPIRTIGDSGKRSGLSFHYQSYLTNRVIGTKDRSILILKFPNNRISSLNRHLRWLQERYTLMDLFLFLNEQWVYVMSLKTFSKERLNKILRATYAVNATEQKKFSRLRMPITPKIDVEGMIQEKKPSFSGMLPSPQRNHYVSAGHVNFFLERGIDIPDYPNTHGNNSHVGITKSKIGVRDLDPID